MIIDYQYLRPQKAQWLREMYAEPFDLDKKLDIWRGINATILPLREEGRGPYRFGLGGVVDENGDAVALSAIETRVGAGYPFENSTYRDEKVVYCGYLINHWGHFLAESVSRLWFALESKEEVDKYVFYLQENEQREIKGNFREFLELIGIWDKTEFINTPTTYREVIVPQNAFLLMGYSSAQFREIFDTVAQRIQIQPDWKPLDKIFFTRSQFAKGNNLDFGVEVLDSFFRNNGQKITIMERLIVNIDYQVGINQLKDLDVTYVDANFNIGAVSMIGPFMMGYNHILQRYMEDHHMNPPDAVYTSEAYRNRCFKQYMRSYWDNYRYRWHMDSENAGYLLALYEAYKDSYPYFREYLDGDRPFLKEHYFQIHYWKQLIKRILRKIKVLPQG